MVYNNLSFPAVWSHTVADTPPRQGQKWAETLAGYGNSRPEPDPSSRPSLAPPPHLLGARLLRLAPIPHRLSPQVLENCHFIFLENLRQ